MSESRPVLTAGTRLRSAVCTTEVVIVRVSDPAVAVECGGAPMVAAGASAAATGAPVAGLDGGTSIGKRYGGPEAPVELLCVKPGAGTLTVDGQLLELRSVKPLPASD